MLTKNELKFYHSLSKKKVRYEHKLFIAEGLRLIQDGLNSDFICELLLITKEFADKNNELIKLATHKHVRIELLKEYDLQKISETVNPQGALAVFRMSYSSLAKIQKSDTIIALENISDPGNLGTVIRTCDWFGFTNIIANKYCADLYNPKVVRSTMGSLFHVNFFQSENFYDDLNALKKQKYKLMTADMNGSNLYNIVSAEKNILCFCNEANGPSLELKNITDEFITIPAKGKAESLNVAIAAAIIISHFGH